MIPAGIFDLSDSVALVTGAGRGLGRAIACGFAAFGADVVVADVDAQTAAATAESVAALGRNSLGLACDVGRRSSVEETVAQSLARFGRIDILVNSAGIQRNAAALELTDEAWDVVMEVNLKGTFLCCQAVGRSMIGRRAGSIINLASITGQVGSPRGGANYSASKGGVVALTRTLALQWASHGVRVNALAPCQFRTDLIAESLADPQRLALTAAAIPLGRLGEPEDIVGAAVFLASRASALVTGHILNVDGGYMAQ